MGGSFGLMRVMKNIGSILELANKSGIPTQGGDLIQGISPGLQQPQAPGQTPTQPVGQPIAPQGPGPTVPDSGGGQGISIAPPPTGGEGKEKPIGGTGIL